MAILQLPTSIVDAIYSMRVDLDGAAYRFDFKFNSRDGFWYFDIADAAGVAIRSSIKVCIDVPLLRLTQTLGRPPGDFVAVDPTEQDQEAEFDNLGTDILLTYIEGSELEA